MKLSWKLFFMITPVMILALTGFGMWLIHITFSESLEKETEQCSLENKYAATSYFFTRRAYEEVSPGRFTEEEVVEGFHKAEEEDEGCLRIYDQDGAVIYEDNALSVHHAVRESLKASGNFGYEICEENGEYYVAAVSLTEDGMTVETLRRVTDVFADREELNSRYRYGLLAASLLMGIILWLTIYLSLRRTGVLSRAARELAEGNLTVRADIRGTDEIALLAGDFNGMADIMEQQMRQLKEEATRQEQFTSAFAHELKTPLTSIIGYSEMLATMDLSEEEIRMCGDYINRQSKRLQSLSYKLLNMALLQKKEISYRPVQCRQLAACVEEVEKLLVESKGLMWRMEVADGQIWGDADLIQSLLMNLIDNGVKASEPGGMILLTGKADGDGYMFLVADQGVGAAKEELSRLTEAFYMADKSRSRKEGGAGLGLTLCRQIAEAHGASLEFDSDTGKGMRVWVRFPKGVKASVKAAEKEK